MFADNQIIDNMNRQSSRNTSNVDAIDCIINSNDLAFEHELVNQEYEQKRTSSDSRRNQPSKRTNGNSTDRSTRHSPPSVTRKRQSSPPTNPSITSRSQHYYYQSQRHQRVSGSPSPPPPPAQTSSRHQRPSRPATSAKRTHSKSRSPHDRRQSTHHSYRDSSKKRTGDDEEFTSTPSVKKQTIKPTLKQEIADLSVISEDESIKPHHIRSNSSRINESPSSTKLHSTPSLPILQPNSNESLFEMSTIPQDCELSLFAKSALSTTNTSSIITTPTHSANDFIQIIDLMSKYKMMQAIPSNNTQIETCSKDIFMLIQKQIELQKKELDYREREMKLRERELDEREKRFNGKPNDPFSLTSASSEPFVAVKSIIIEEKPQYKSELDIKNVSKEESVEQSIPSAVDASKVDLVNKPGPGVPPLTRKNREKSRFSQLIVDPSVFTPQKTAVVDLYADDNVDIQSSSFINSFKKTIPSKILAPSESTTKSIIDTDLKVTSSNSCRKVEIQSETILKPTTTSKGSSHDLRLTLSKNRTKQQNNDSNQVLNNDEQIVTMDKPMSSKINSIKDDKQQSHDYHQQRSVTSTSMETIIDDTNDKRDHHRHQQRANSSRQQQYPGPNFSSPITGANERSYTHGSPSQQPLKYGSTQKRHGTDDLRSHLFEHKPPKSSRSTHRDNY